MEASVCVCVGAVYMHAHVCRALTVLYLLFETGSLPQSKNYSGSKQVYQIPLCPTLLQHQD